MMLFNRDMQKLGGAVKSPPKVLVPMNIFATFYVKSCLYRKFSYKYVITFICHIKATIFSFSANIPVFVSQKLVNFTHLHKQMRIFHMKIITQKLLMKKRLKSQKRWISLLVWRTAPYIIPLI